MVGESGKRRIACCVYIEINYSNLREEPVTFTQLEDFKKVQDLKFIYERRFNELKNFSRDAFADCLERSSGVLGPAVELLQAGYVFANVTVVSRKTLFTHEEDHMLLEGRFHDLVKAKSLPIVMERLEYLGYRLEEK